MMGSYVRDKDAVTASVMIAEMAAHYFEGHDTAAGPGEPVQGIRLVRREDLNLLMPGLDGLEK